MAPKRKAVDQVPASVARPRREPKRTVSYVEDATEPAPKRGRTSEVGDVDARHAAWAPMGQQQVTPSREWVAKMKLYREKPLKWSDENSNLMSFELWCVATGYDPGKDDGGGTFQQLMNYLLVYGHGFLPEHTTLANNYYTRGGRGPMWGRGSSHDATLAGLKHASGKALHSPQTQGVHKIRGGGIGHLSGASTGFSYALSGGSNKAQAGDWQVSVPRSPCSKLNWLQSVAAKQQMSGMVTNKGGKSSNTSEVQFATTGSAENCEELQGCMAQANLTAAIFGMYYYPGCNESKNNWTVKQDIGGSVYAVRMRMWNPAYEWLDGRLLVKELLNRDADWDAPLGTTRIVGGLGGGEDRLGFFLPDVFKEAREDVEQGERKFPLEPMRLIRGTNDATRLAPFFGLATPATGIGAQNERYRALCLRLSTAWPHLVHKPDADASGAYFGFNVPKAHWLYPHYILDNAEIAGKTEPVSGRHVTTEETYNGNAYQLWPMWRYKTAEERSDAITSTRVFRFYQLFEEVKLETFSARQRRAYALRTVTSATTTRSAPSRVNVVDLPPNVPAPPAPELGEQTTELDPMETNVDGTEQEGLDAIRREAALDVGFVKDSALNIESQASMLENEGRGYDVGIEQDPVKLRKQFNELTGFTGLTKSDIVEGLQPGAARSGKVRRGAWVGDLNPHWYSARHQPWPHRDLYDVSGLSLEVGERMGEEALEQYRKDYGSTHNLYLRGETTPLKINGIAPQFGLARSVLNDLITKDTKLHRQHLCRILAVYFYDGDIGRTDNKITAKQKRDGMLGGVWCTKTCGEQTPFTASRCLTFGRPKSVKEYVCIWPPVFSKPPDESWANAFDLSMIRGDNDQHHDCIVASKLEKMKRVKSVMTVLQWVTSPWHYAFLPYQPCSVLFKDGETYSEGCSRCSRPFYEFEHMYSWFRLSEDKTQHWQTSYFHASGNPCGQACAPKPFHFPKFWSEEQVHAHNLPDEPRDADKSHVGVDEDGGWHNWPTYEFQLHPNSPYLTHEYARRKRVLEATGIAGKITRGRRPLIFRQYLNHVWDAERVAFWGKEYPTYPQGRISKGKVALGMRDYMLQRSSKYGNTCKDCAAVLELAPGLYHRNHRTVFDTGVVVGNSKKHKTAETWWANLIHRVGGKAGMMAFDPIHMHSKGGVSTTTSHESYQTSKSTADRAAYMKSFEESMATYAAYLSEQHNVASTGTKYKDPPDIYIQKAVPDMSDSSKKADHQMIKEAIRDLRTMLDKPREQWDINTKNKAFRDMVYELERKYVHKERFRHDSATKVFDSEMVRLEIRNDVRVHPTTKKTYHNCLVTRLYNPRGPADGSVRDPENDFTETVYYATRRGDMGNVECDEAEPTMWCGDGYVTLLDKSAGYWKVFPDNKKKNNPVKQWRKMRQSRLFITYSLHRAVTSEFEARLIMERMADAAHELFGNDRNLSELLVFGYKLGGFGARGETTDTISKAQFELIQAPNKKDAVLDFYGESGASSYVYDTYETHVEKVEVDGGIEIGPNRHHPHFHILITINHWSYVQIDYFKMNAYLELMFRGLDPLERGWGDRFQLKDASGGLFYTDNENPHVDIKLYPQDNWSDVIAAYVRKNATPGIMETLGARTGNV